VASTSPSEPGDDGADADYRWIVVRAMGTRVDTPEALLGLFDALEQTGLAPQRYFVADGAPELPFSRKAIASDAEGALKAGHLYFRSDDNVGGDLAFGFRPNVSYWKRNETVTKADIISWLSLAEQIRDRMTPEFLVVGFGPLGPRDERGRPTWTDDLERDHQLLVKTSFSATKDYFRFGPLGLGLRTYLGPHFAELLGRRRLQSCPGVLRDIETGGVELDVAGELASTPYDELLRAWRGCVDHLAEAEVFARPTIDEERRRIRYRQRSARCTMPQREAPE